MRIPKPLVGALLESRDRVARDTCGDDFIAEKRAEFGEVFAQAVASFLETNPRVEFND